jgi:CRP-like cAMP-binding protein
MSSNRILSRAGFGLLEPHLQSVDLPVRKKIEVPKKRIDQVYFIEAGCASVVVKSTSKPTIDIGINGREGMTGPAVMRGNDRLPHEKVAGRGQHISAANLRATDEQSPALHRAMLRNAHAFLHQTTTKVLANDRSKIDERLARRLLMADDRIDGDALSLTHEFRGLALGTYRPGVTKAIQDLRRAHRPGRIKQDRSKSSRRARTRTRELIHKDDLHVPTSRQSAHS